MRTQTEKNTKNKKNNIQRETREKEIKRGFIPGTSTMGIFGTQPYK